MNLKDKVIYVTGASLGIGYEIASELLKQDAKVVITARNKENLDKAKNTLSKISNNECTKQLIYFVHYLIVFEYFH